MVEQLIEDFEDLKKYIFTIALQIELYDEENDEIITAFANI